LEVLGKSNQIIANNSTFIIGSNTINTPTAPYSFTIKNVGTVTLNIVSISALSPFSIVKQVNNLAIAPGATQSFEVVGVPKDASAPTMSLISITSDDVNSPFIMNVGVTVGVPTGVASALSSTAIDLFPNPSFGNANLEFNGTFDHVSVTVYMANGSKVYTANLATMAESSAELQLQDLPAGVYIIEVNSDQGKLIKRFIKN